MRIHFGCELQLACEHPIALAMLLSVRSERRRRLVIPDSVEIPSVASGTTFIDAFGNIGTRTVVGPSRRFIVKVEGTILDSGKPDPVVADARQVPSGSIPSDILPFLMSSRYCEVDILIPFAWEKFGATRPGWERVQAICDFVHGHVAFGYEHARSTRSAVETLREKVGVCRDFAHLAVALCRAMGVPARYASGYLGDIGVPLGSGPMDFSAWFEVWLDGGWFAFDARHNRPRIGRIPVAYGRDATDVAFVTSFGSHQVLGFRVWTDAIDTPHTGVTMRQGPRRIAASHGIAPPAVDAIEAPG